LEKDTPMTQKAFQDYYSENFASCFGCGRLNEHGLHIKSYWDGEESVCRFKPRHYHTGGFPGNVYGGLIASLMDCHGAGTAYAATVLNNGGDAGTDPASRYVTAALHVDYLAPTPMNETLEIRGTVKEIHGRKVIVSMTLSVKETVCAKGEVVMVRISEASVSE